MRELFVPRDFNTSSRILIRQANEIIEEYREQGFVLTLRQLYYQFVQRNLLPNRQKEYKRLGSVLNDARLAGKVDWDMIEDRTRQLEDLPKWDSPESLVRAAAEQYRTDIWAWQPRRVEVWIEKEALTGVIDRVCRELRMPFFACRGYTSQSEQYRAGKRIKHYIRRGQKMLILHLGDHDPSGVDMTRDNNDRLLTFCRGLPDFDLERIALNMDQIEEYNLPPNPLKRDGAGMFTDTRGEKYDSDHGDNSWELDALEPQTIENLIRDTVAPLIDDVEWRRVEAEEAEQRRLMLKVARRYGDVTTFIERPDYE